MRDATHVRVTRRRKRAFVWKSKQNQCDNELLNAYHLAMTRRMDRNHTDKYQVSLGIVFILKHKFHKFMPLLTLNLSCENVKYPARKHFEKTNNKFPLKFPVLSSPPCASLLAVFGSSAWARSRRVGLTGFVKVVLDRDAPLLLLSSGVCFVVDVVTLETLAGASVVGRSVSEIPVSILYIRWPKWGPPIYWSAHSPGKHTVITEMEILIHQVRNCCWQVINQFIITTRITSDPDNKCIVHFTVLSRQQTLTTHIL